MNQKIASLERVSFIILLCTIGLSIISFLPASILPLAAVKTLLVALGVMSSLIVYVFARMKTNTVEISWNPLIITGACISLAVAISAILSQNLSSAFFGKSFSVDTASFIIFSFIAFYLSYFFSKGKKDRTLYVLLTILGSFALVALFQCVRLLVGPDTFSFGAFSSVVGTMLGSWHDFGTLTGFICVISFITLEFLPLTKRLKIATAVVFGFSAILLVVIGFSSVWMILAIVAFGIALYKYYLDMHVDDKKWLSKIPVFSLVIVVVALGLSFKGYVISGPIVDKLKANYYEVSLPWTYTVDVAAPTIKESPLFGAGPTHFVNQYMKYKPQVINSTQFWSVDFISGSNFVLTSLVTQGLVGFVLWILFLVYLFIYGCKGLVHSAKNHVARYTLAVTIFGATFLWLSLLTYNPSHVILFITFIISGLFIGEYVREHGGTIKTIEYKEGKKAVRILVQTISWIIIVVSAVWGLYILKHAVAEWDFQAGVYAVTTLKSPSSAAMYVNKAVGMYPSDAYYQAQAQLGVYRINQLVGSIGTSTPDQATLSAIASTTADAVTAAKNAEKVDPTNVYNYLVDAQISEVAARLKYPGAYDNAKAAYIRAAQIDPYDPSIYLAYSQLVFLNNDFSEGSVGLSAALQLKPDYTDALFEAAVVSYNSKNFEIARAAVARLIAVDPKYPNAEELQALIQKNSTTPVSQTQVAPLKNTPVPSIKGIQPITSSTTGKTPKR
jgi:O-antigen ligase/tetratricopeptide (TPR) repeat protein